MKKLLIILLATGLAFSSSAQKFSHGGGFYHGRSRVIVSAGVYAPFYPRYGYYGYHYYPYYPDYGYVERPTRLDLKVADIKNDYKDKIWSARHDKSLSRKERRNVIHNLRHERDKAIIQAKKDYYKTK